MGVGGEGGDVFCAEGVEVGGGLGVEVEVCVEG